VTPEDRINAMVVTNGARRLMHDWASGPIVDQYSLSPDWDDRWRTGGSVEEVMEEAHLTAGHILAALERFAADSDKRRSLLRPQL
jgi:transketolase